MDEEILDMLKGLGDRNRLQIIEMLMEGETCSCKILEKMQISQPTLSHHMKILSDCGLITSRRDAQWIKYTLNKEKITMICTYLYKIIKGNDPIIPM